MASLQSILRRQEEARYISRTWSRPSSVPDVAGHVHIENKPKLPDDIVHVWKLGADGLLHKTGITRAQFDAEFEAMLAKNREEAKIFNAKHGV
jgi:hypothetical protein